MRVNSRKMVKILNELAPAYMAESWDNVGFQIGNINKAIGKVMVCLEVTDAVIDEAINKNVDLIISHHPLLFKGLKQLTDDDPVQRRVRKLIQNDINVYAAHTNLDSAEGGLNDYLAQLIGLERVDILSKSGHEESYKLVVFVPESHAEEVHASLMAYGAGHIGNYCDTSFRSLGLGTFRPLEGTQPYLGEEGKLEKVEETRIETIVLKKDLKNVLNAMLNAHPYEEVAYDLYKLENEVDPYGIGRVGYLLERQTMGELIETVKGKLGINVIKYVGDSERKVGKVAICTGAGASLIGDAIKHACEVLITGDVKYHEALFAEDHRLQIIDAGHFETENIFCKELKRRLELKLEAKDYDVQVIVAESAHNPFQYMI